jgi:hypothetical protein
MCEGKSVSISLFCECGLILKGGFGGLTCFAIYLSLCSQASSYSVSFIAQDKIRGESLDSFEELGAGCSIFWEKLKFLCATKTSSGHLERNISALPSGQQKKEFLAFCQKSFL